MRFKRWFASWNNTKSSHHRFLQLKIIKILKTLSMPPPWPDPSLGVQVSDKGKVKTVHFLKRSSIHRQLWYGNAPLVTLLINRRLNPVAKIKIVTIELQRFCINYDKKRKTQKLTYKTLSQKHMLTLKLSIKTFIKFPNLSIRPKLKRKKLDNFLCTKNK